MRLIDADVTSLRPAPDYGRIEAEVRLVYARTGEAPCERTILTSAPIDDPRGRPMHARLVADAFQLALRLPESPKIATGIAA